MFLTERLVSLAIYSITLILACYLYGHIVIKQEKIILSLYLICLGFFAFYYKPYITADLFRIRQYIQYWINLDWANVVQYAIKSPNASWVIYAWLVNKIGNINWLQTIACIWTFFNLFYIVEHSVSNQEVISVDRERVLFYLMSVGAIYLQAISGIRTILGLSIIAFCVYRENIEGRSLASHILLYIIAALMHVAIIPVVLARIIFLIPKQNTFAKKNIMSLLCIVIIATLFYYGSISVSSSFEMAQRYLNSKSQYSYFWEIIIGILELLRQLSILRKIRMSIYSDKGSEFHSYWWFNLLWCIVSILALPFSYTIFRRYTMFGTMLSITLYASTIKEDKNAGTVFATNINFLSILIFVLSVLRGDLCGYKFFEL